MEGLSRVVTAAGVKTFRRISQRQAHCGAVGYPVGYPSAIQQEACGGCRTGCPTMAESTKELTEEGAKELTRPGNLRRKGT